jgi:pyruvate dehydrogenase E2 component (dihydrolipoamide acetyltransferase)
MADAFTRAPLSPLRKIIAARMSEAKRTIPHFRVARHIDVGALLELRERANSAAPDRRVSINDCIIRACALALQQHPDVNVQLVGDELHLYPDADISVVVAVDGGLLTPVVRAANRKSLQAIAAEMRALTARAATKQLRMDEIAGGSFSISNLGAYGVDQFDAIINPPQCAILALGSAKPQMLAAADGTRKMTTVLTATLSVDHRAIDGVGAAKFLSTLADRLQQPTALFDEM